GIDLDLPFFHGISPAHLHAQALPDPNAAGNISAADPLAQTLGKHHAVSLHRGDGGAEIFRTRVNPAGSKAVYTCEWNAFGGPDRRRRWARPPETSCRISMRWSGCTGPGSSGFSWPPCGTARPLKT